MQDDPEDEEQEEGVSSRDPEGLLEDDVRHTMRKHGKPHREVTAWIVGDQVVDKGKAWSSLQQDVGEDLRKQVEHGTETDGFEERYEALRKDSKQIVSDTMQQQMDAGNLTVVRPPYSLDQLLYLRELQPLHSAALEQLVADVVGNGFRWKPKSPDVKDDELVAAAAFLDEPNDEMTFLELMQAVWLDRRTLGFGCFEISRKGDGSVDEIYHVPAHTIRIKIDNKRFLQQRAGQYIWFKAWGEKRILNQNTGLWQDETPGSPPIPEEAQANELFMFKLPTGRSSFYPIPGYVSAIASIATAIALHDYNRTFFTRYAIPSWAIIMEGADLTPSLKATIEQFFRSEVRGNPHRVLTLSLPYFPIRQTGENRVKITFTRLSDQVKDMSFRYLNQAVSLEIVIAHRMPPYRIGWPITGSLGGSSAKEMNVMYKTGVVNPEQAVLQARMTKFFKKEFSVNNHEFDVVELDITDAQEDMTYSVQGIKGVVHTIDEGRKHVGLQPLPGGKGKVFVLPGGYSIYDPTTGDFKTAPKAGGEMIEDGSTTGQVPVPGQPVPAKPTNGVPPNGQPKQPVAPVGKPK